MGFFITYSVAAIGPFFSGVLLDTFESWTVVFSVVAVIALTQLFFVRPLRRNVAVD
jgi:cyanate permease